MGQDINHAAFTSEDYQRFNDRLQQQLITLESLLSDSNFGVGEQTIGAELEIPITNGHCMPSLIAPKVLATASMPNLQHELNKYNLECNLDPVAIKGKPFSNIKKQIEKSIKTLNKHCQKFDSKVVPIGIIPTLQDEHVSEEVMTDVMRYKALASCITEYRKGSLKLDINGCESFKKESNTITLEGANTSFQLQIKVAPQEFPDLYNAVQIATPLAVAVAANSPILLNKILWDETRIALFKQSVDTRRDEENTHWRQPHRVSFGYGWVRRSALECFAESVALFPPLLPYCRPDEYTPQPNDGPDLFELRLHQGVVWHWNRAIYDPIDGGHLRIEIRALPSGPTPIDMVANAAFLIGLAYAIKQDINKFLVSYPFMFAEYNFYRAAKHGLNAHLIWPLYEKDYSQAKPISDILYHYLPLASNALESLGVSRGEVNTLMAIIENRIRTGQNGASWQRATVQQYDAKLGREKAINKMFEQYINYSKTGAPVHTWESA